MDEQGTVFERYEIPMEISPVALETAVWQFHCLIQNLQTEGVSTAEYESKVREAWAKTEVSETEVSTLEAIQSLVWNLVEHNGPAAVRLFDALGELRSDVKDERDYQVRMYARLNRPKSATSSEFEQGKKDAEEIREFIETTYNGLTMFRKEIPETVKVKTLEKSQERKVDLPRIPNGPREGGGGRKSATHNLRLIVDGEKYDLPIDRVCHDVLSSGTNRVSVSDLLDTLKSLDLDFGKGWEAIDFAGHFVAGVVEKSDSEDESDNSDSESDDNPEFGPPAPEGE